MTRETIAGYISTIVRLISTLLVNVTRQQKKKTPNKSKDYWRGQNEPSLLPLRNYPSEDPVVPQPRK
jgi:hypothetical protein